MKKAKRLAVIPLAVLLALALVFTASACGEETIDGERELVSIAVTTPPTKTDYISGEYFQRVGMVVTATYSDGTTEPVLGYTVDKTAPLTTADTVVTIAFRQKTTTINITVTAPPPKVLESMATVETDARHTYRVEAEALSLEWCKPGVETPKVEVPGVNEENTSGGQCISGLGNGGNELGIRIDSKVESSLSITVCAAYGNPDGMPFDSCITTYWNDKKIMTETRVWQKNPANTYWDWMTFTIEGLTLKVGENTLWFKIASAAPWFDYFDFNVNPNILERIEVTGVRDHREYETFDPTGMVVTAYYEDGTSEPVTDYAVEETGALKLGEKTVTVTYRKKSAAVSFDVTEMIADNTAQTYRIEAEYIDTQGTSAWIADHAQGTSGGKLLAGFVHGDEFAVEFNSAVADVDVTATVCAAYGSTAGFDFAASIDTLWNGEEITLRDVVVAASAEGDNAWFDWNTFDIGGLTLKEGKNTLKFKVHADVPFVPNFDYFDFEVSGGAPLPAPAKSYRVEAEDVTVVRETGNAPATPDGTGVSGGKYLDGLAAGDEFGFSFASDAAGYALAYIGLSYGGDITFDDNIATYWNDGPEKIATGIKHVPVDEGSGKWDNWQRHAVRTMLPVTAGKNTLKFQVTGTPVRFDYVEFVVCGEDASAGLIGDGAVRVEAETFGKVWADPAVPEAPGKTEGNEHASAGNILAGINGSFEIVVYSAIAAKTDLTVTVCAAYGNRVVFDEGMKTVWNGTETATGGVIDSQDETNKWDDFLTFTFTVELLPGRNVLYFTQTGSVPNIDYVEFAVA